MNNPIILGAGDIPMADKVSPIVILGKGCEGPPPAPEIPGPSSSCANREERAIAQPQAVAETWSEVVSAPVGLGIKLAYATPRFSIRAAYVLVQVYALLYYLQLGAQLRIMAFYMAIGRSLDVVTDPCMAWITDTTRSAFGRRKPYLFAGLFVYSLTFGLLFHPPEDVNVAHWYGAFYILFFLSDTFANVPYYALGMEITSDYNERTSVYFWQFLTGQLGILVGGVLPGALPRLFGMSLRPAYYTTGWLFAAVYFIGIILLLCFVKERPLRETSTDRGAPMARNIIRILRNRAFVPLLVSMLLDYGVVGMVAAMVPFFVQYVLISPGSHECSEPCKEWFPGGDDCDCGKLATLWLSYFMGVVFIAAVVSTPFWFFVSRRLSKRNAWMAQNYWNVITNPWFIFCTEGDIYFALFIAALNGSGFGGQFLNEAILADLSDYDEFLYGDRLEGMLGTVGILGPKIVLVFTGVLPLALIAGAGFRDSTWPEEFVMRDRLGQKPCDDFDYLESCPKTPISQSSMVTFIIRLLFCVVPSAAALLSIWFKIKFPIKSSSQMQAIHEGISLHKQGKPAMDPISGRIVTTIALEDDHKLKQLHHLEMWGGVIGGNSKSLKAILCHDLARYGEADVATSGTTISRDAWKPIFVRAVAWVVGPAVSLLASIIATAATYDMLQESSGSWVPTCLSMCAGVALTVLIVGALRLRSALQLPDMDISISLLWSVLSRTSDPAVPSE